MAAPFTEAELDRVEKSLRNLHAADAEAPDYQQLRTLLSEYAHLSHKDWARTELAADKLAAILGGPDDQLFRDIFQRVLRDGFWGRAVHATDNGRKPWVVLVTGLNGIRKTSSVYEPWFRRVLAAALSQSSAAREDLAPESPNKKRKLEAESAALDDYPDGSTAFFRQLDYMIATIANVDFKELYAAGYDVAHYSERKADIFSRYRMCAEMVGVLLMKAAQKKRMDVMLETSGRDIAMFHYVDTFFNSDSYRKLVVHFRINELKYAEGSVDSRMTEEMAQGTAALASGDVRAIVDANAGGPYGSAVLAGVQADSSRVWAEVLSADPTTQFVGWEKATIDITGSDSEPWVVSAVGSNERHEFGPRR